MKPICRFLPLLIIALLVGCLPTTPLHESINQPGDRIDWKAHRVVGKTNVIHFYADWCPACQNWKPTLDAINAQFSDMAVHFVNIGDFDSPVARQYGITAVPRFQIVGKNGRVLAQGKEAEGWLRREIDRRVAHRR
jgi:thiol-disulfide isomerase/thioredoxin